MKCGRISLTFSSIVRISALEQSAQAFSSLQRLWVNSSAAEALCQPAQSPVCVCVWRGGYFGWQQHVESQWLVERLAADLAPFVCVCSSLCRLAGCPGSFNFHLTAFSDVVSSVWAFSNELHTWSTQCWTTERQIHNHKSFFLNKTLFKRQIFKQAETSQSNLLLKHYLKKNENRKSVERNKPTNMILLYKHICEEETSQI